MNSAWIHFSFPSWADSILENLDVRQRISSGGQHLAFLFFTRSWSLRVWCCLIIFILSLNQNNELGRCFTNIFRPLMMTSSLHWTWESNISIALFFIHWLKFVLSIYFYLGHHPLGMVNPPGATPLKNTNSPLETTCPEFFRRVWGFINSSQLHPAMLTDLIFTGVVETTTASVISWMHRHIWFLMNRCKYMMGDLCLVYQLWILGIIIVIYSWEFLLSNKCCLV